MSFDVREFLLSECLEKVIDNRGKTPPTTDLVTPFPLMEINAIVGNSKNPNYSVIKKYVSEQTYSSWFRAGHPQPNDIIFSTVGSIAEIALFREGNGCIAQNLVGLRPNLKLVTPDYLYYTLTSPLMQSRLKSLDISSVQPSIKLPHLLETKITLPALSIQNVIGSFLSNIDDRIALLQKTNLTLDSISQALFKSWFISFDPVHSKVTGSKPEGMDHATSSIFPDGFEQSEYGEIPRGWQNKKLSDVCSYLSRGISPKYIEEGGVLVINQKCIRDSSIDYSKARRHDSAQKKVNGRELIVGDVLVNSTGVGTLGRVAQVLSLPEVSIADSHVTVLRAHDELKWTYLGEWLSLLQPVIESMGEGSTGQTELSRSQLGDLRILVPTQPILSAFDNIVYCLKEKRANNEAQISALAKVRDTLLPRLLQGQISITGIEVDSLKVMA